MLDIRSARAVGRAYNGDSSACAPLHNGLVRGGSLPYRISLLQRPPRLHIPRPLEHSLDPLRR